MSEVIFPRSPMPFVSGEQQTKHVGAPNLSPLVATSLVALVVGGPLGSVVAIVFGWAARRELRERQASRLRLLSTIGMMLGLCFTIAWGAAIAYVVMSVEQRAALAASPSSIASEQAVKPSADEASSDGGIEQAAHEFPKLTTSRRYGVVTMVDMGASISSLSNELAKQRAEASRAGDVMIVMTTRHDCSLCTRFDSLLDDALLQSALGHVRIVRVDVELFDEDLGALRIPRDRVPGFFLLAPDLFPRDGIDDGEWNEDVAANMAPVLGAFVRGKYGERRQAWRPVADNGMRL